MSFHFLQSCSNFIDPDFIGPSLTPADILWSHAISSFISFSMYSFHESLIPFSSIITLPDTPFRQFDLMIWINVDKKFLCIDSRYLTLYTYFLKLKMFFQNKLGKWGLANEDSLGKRPLKVDGKNGDDARCESTYIYLCSWHHDMYGLCIASDVRTAWRKWPWISEEVLDAACGTTGSSVPWWKQQSYIKPAWLCSDCVTSLRAAARTFEHCTVDQFASWRRVQHRHNDEGESTAFNKWSDSWSCTCCR